MPNQHRIIIMCCAFVQQGILGAYYNALRQVDLFGPTNFSSFLDKTMEYCNASPTSQNSQNYFILLVITVSISVHSFTVELLYSVGTAESVQIKGDILISGVVLYTLLCS